MFYCVGCCDANSGAIVLIGVASHLCSATFTAKIDPALRLFESGFAGQIAAMLCAAYGMTI
jgi:hypothetical protein